ncbi:MAG: PAS domain-containing sensor histidine kinase [Pseudomonadota bacterium]
MSWSFRSAFLTGVSLIVSASVMTMLVVLLWLTQRTANQHQISMATDVNQQLNRDFLQHLSQKTRLLDGLARVATSLEPITNEPARFKEWADQFLGFLALNQAGLNSLGLELSNNRYAAWQAGKVITEGVLPPDVSTTGWSLDDAVLWISQPLPTYGRIWASFELNSWFHDPLRDPHHLIFLVDPETNVMANMNKGADQTVMDHDDHTDHGDHGDHGDHEDHDTHGTHEDHTATPAAASHHGHGTTMDDDEHVTHTAGHTDTDTIDTTDTMDPVAISGHAGHDGHSHKASFGAEHAPNLSSSEILTSFTACYQPGQNFRSCPLEDDLFMSVTSFYPSVDRTRPLAFVAVTNAHNHELDLAAQRESLFIVLSVAGATLVISLILGALLAHRIARPVLTLRENSELVRHNLSASLSPIKTSIREIATAGSAFLDMAQGIRDQQNKNLQLTKNLIRFSQAVDQSPIGVAMTDDHGRIDYTNTSLCALLGLPRSKIVKPEGQRLAVYEVIEQIADFFPPPIGLKKADEDGQIWAWQKTFINFTRSDGTIAWISLQVFPLKQSDGSNSFVLIALDLTESKRLENKLKRAHEEMEQRVKDRTRVLSDEVKERRRAERAAEHASRVKSEFLANMSHELRTPLNAIIGFSETILAEIFGPIDNPQYKEYLADIHKSGKFLLSIITDILDLSRIEAGRMDLSLAPFTMATLARSTLNMIQPLANEKKVTITDDIAPDLPDVLADETRIQQILMNLLSNAVKFTEQHGQVTLSIQRTGEEIDIRIIDTGVGMTKDEIDHAMTMFGRVKSADYSSAEGTGIGLPLTRRLVETHGGRLTLISTPGKGTTAQVVLPIQAKSAEPVDKVPSPA